MYDVNKIRIKIKKKKKRIRHSFRKLYLILETIRLSTTFKVENIFTDVSPFSIKISFTNNLLYLTTVLNEIGHVKPPYLSIM